MTSLHAFTFGDQLRHARKAAGLTQEELAERAGVAPETVSALERGVNRAPHRDTVESLSDALGLDDRERASIVAAGRPARSREMPPLPAASGAVMIPLVGRRWELDQVTTWLADVEQPPVLLVAGEPGIGKSRLLAEVARQAPMEGWRVLAGGCTQRGAQEPFAPLLSALANGLHAHSPAELRDALKGCAWLVTLLPELRETPDLSAPEAGLPPAQERRLMFAAVRRVLANIAGPAGTLLLLDDLQWAGQDGLDLLASLVHPPAALAPVTTAAPLVRVLGAYRSTEAPSGEPLAALQADLARDGLAARLTLKPLMPEEAAELLRRVLMCARGGAQALPQFESSAWQERLVARTGGVPFFLVSYARALQTGGLDERTSEDEAASAALPWDVAETIRQRIAVLSSVARDLLPVAAIAGREVTEAVLVAASRQSEHEVVAALDAACRARLLVEVTDERTYRFAHDLIRELVEGDLSAARGALLHRQVAEALEAQPGEPPLERLAYHYHRAGVAERAVLYLERAGDHALNLHANAKAEFSYRTLVERLDALGNAADAARAREKLAGVLQVESRFDAELTILDDALQTYRVLGDAEGTGRVVVQIIFTYAAGEYGDEGLAHIRPLVEAGALTGVALRTQTLAYLYLVGVFFGGGRHAEALAAAERAITLGGRLGDTAVLGEAHTSAGIALRALGRMAEAIQTFAAALPLAEANSEHWSLPRLLTHIGLAHDARGEFTEGRRMLERALELAERSGEHFRRMVGSCSLGINAYLSGDWERARAFYTRARELALQEGRFTDDICLYLGMLELTMGRWDDAERELARATTLAEPKGMLHYLPHPHDALTERELLAGCGDAAKQRLAPLIEHPRLQKLEVAKCLHLLAWAHLELGELEAAERWITQAVELATAHDYQIAWVDAQRIQALVAARQGRHEQADGMLELVLSRCRAMPYPYAEAKALYVSGCLSLEQGAREHACERLAAALEICVRLGEELYRPVIVRALASALDEASWSGEEELRDAKWIDGEALKC
jgi:tetratricopeptide (TPR) repeat protein/transcriptional regulator with XRE-family HTH domain